VGWLDSVGWLDASGPGTDLASDPSSGDTRFGSGKVAPGALPFERAAEWSGSLRTGSAVTIGVLWSDAVLPGSSSAAVAARSGPRFGTGTRDEEDAVTLGCGAFRHGVLRDAIDFSPASQMSARIGYAPWAVQTLFRPDIVSH